MKKAIKRLKRKIKRAIDWYILGEYHCDKCPYCWEERSYEGDCDAGCYIKGDIYDTCRLLPPFRFLIGYFRKKKSLYYFNHEYDGFVEFMVEQNKRETTMMELINKYVFEKEELYTKNHNGEYVAVEEVNDNNLSFKSLIAAFNIMNEYEETIHPVEHKKLRQKWAELIKETINSFINKFKPYFCK